MCQFLSREIRIEKRAKFPLCKELPEEVRLYKRVNCGLFIFIFDSHGVVKYLRDVEDIVILTILQVVVQLERENQKARWGEYLFKKKRNTTLIDLMLHSSYYL